MLEFWGNNETLTAADCTNLSEVWDTLIEQSVILTQQSPSHYYGSHKRQILWNSKQLNEDKAILGWKN